MDRILFTPLELTDKDFDGVYNGRSESFFVKKLIGTVYNSRQIEEIKRQAVHDFMSEKTSQGYCFIKPSKRRGRPRKIKYHGTD